MKFLLIEDDDYKRDKIFESLTKIYPDSKFTFAKSVTSAIIELESIESETLILLDMSLPTYDQDKSSSGGRPQGFGGVEILRNIEFYELLNKVLVITQYESISLDNRVLDISDLEIELFKEFSEFFIGLVHFSVISDSWKNELEKIINGTIND